MPKKPSVKSKAIAKLKKTPEYKRFKKFMSTEAGKAISSATKLTKSLARGASASRKKKSSPKTSGSPLQPVKNVKVYNQNIKIRNKRLQDALKGKF